MPSEFDKIFSHMDKKAKKDPSVFVKKPGDITISSRIPFSIPSGIPQLDFCLGKPGLPAGRVVEYFGFEMCGKTTAALHVLAEAQRMGGGGLFIDTEFSWDKNRATEIGVDIDTNLALGESDTIEGIFRQIEACLDGLIESSFNKPFVIVVDSVTAAETEFHKEREFGMEPRPGQDARTIRSGMRKIMSKIAKSNVIIIFINHAISTIASTPFAKRSNSSGGHAIKLFAAVRVQFTGGKALTKNVDKKKKRYGQLIYIKLEKLKGSRLEWEKFDINLLNDVGFDTTGSLLEACISAGLVDHTEGSKEYVLSGGLPEPYEFPKEDWPNVITMLGGLDQAYAVYRDWSLKNGVIADWGGVEG